MNCIVTAGPTYEPLDDVRRLTNFSTGRLGTELANYLVARGHTVTLLIGAMATHSGERNAQAVKIFTTTDDLRSKFNSLSNKKVDAIFHAAAVSDFAFGKLFVRRNDGKLSAFKASKKISTRRGQLLAELVPTPKIIACLRKWFPSAQIVGWKYEADGARSDAISSALKQIAECRTDACVANGPAYGRGFGLITLENRSHFRGPSDLFVALENLIPGN